MCFLWLFGFHSHSFHSVPLFRVCTAGCLCSAWVDTHGLGVHKAAIGACCCGLHSVGPKRGIDPLVDRCRYLHIHRCCTSGTDRSPPHTHGPHLLVWGGGQATHKYSIFICLDVCYNLLLWKSRLETTDLIILNWVSEAKCLSTVIMMHCST